MTTHEVPHQERRRFVRAVGIISLFTMLSRILGFVRDVVIARAFGAGMGADAFFVALKIPNFLRRLFAEGSFNPAFVPVFSDYLTKGELEETRRAAQSVFTMLTLVLLGVVALGQIIMPLFILVAAPGFADQPEKYQLTVDLTRVTFPYILFISLTALCGGILNSLHRYSVPAATPAILNIALITGALYLSPLFEQPAMGLAWGVFLGGAVQLAIQIPTLIRADMPLRFRWEPHHPAIRRILYLMGPSLLGVSVSQISLLIDIMLASLLPEGSISYLYYADRLVELPLGLVGIAMGTAILPALSAKASRQDFEGMKGDLDFALRMMTVINLPAAIALMVLGEPILSLLFERGAFNAEATRLTAQALLAFSAGLMAFSMVKVVAPAFYAMKDTRTPVRIAIISLLVNMVLNVLLMIPFKHAGLALATTLTSYLNLVLLLRALHGRIGFHPGRGVAIAIGKSGAASLVMALFLAGGLHLFWQPGLSTLLKLALLLPLMAGGMGIYLGTAHLLHMAELRDLIQLLRRKKVTPPQGDGGTPPPAG